MLKDYAFGLGTHISQFLDAGLVKECLAAEARKIERNLQSSGNDKAWSVGK